MSDYNETTGIFTSDDFDIDSKEILKLQKSWGKKLEGWINPNWGIELLLDSYNV